MKHTRLIVALVVGSLIPVLAACSSGSETDSTSPGEVGSVFSSKTAPQFDYDFPTGPAVLVEANYEPPEDHVPSTGAYLPTNGKPTLVFVDAIWCPTCALTRPIFHDLRHEYQDQVNLVVLDYDLDADAELANSLGVHAHPAWAVIAPNSDEVVERRFGPLNEEHLRELLASIVDGAAGA